MSSLLRVACVMALLACVGSFLWAMQGNFFRAVGPLGRGFRLIQLCGSLAFVTNLTGLVACESIGAIPGIAALSLYALSFAQFWWSIATHRARPPTHAFSSDIPEILVSSGPYHVTRHPFYSSYLITWIAGPIATRESLLLLPFCAMWIIYWQAARLEEGKFARSALRNEYARYRARTGMFLPWI